jgi:hypothetical protein
MTNYLDDAAYEHACDTVDLSDAVLLVDSRHGIYVPQIFAGLCREDGALHGKLSGASAVDMATIDNPDDDWYLEAWNMVEQNARITLDDGREYCLYQDGDLWAVPV